MFGSKTAAGPTLIGEGASVVGDLKVEGRIQVDGRIEGSLLVKGQVSIGPRGCVEGELVADDAAVGGEVKGTITVRNHLHVVATGRVRGQVHYKSLEVDRGAVIDGTTHQGKPSVTKETTRPPKAVENTQAALRPSQAPAPAGPN